MGPGVTLLHREYSIPYGVPRPVSPSPDPKSSSARNKTRAMPQSGRGRGLNEDEGARRTGQRGCRPHRWGAAGSVVQGGGSGEGTHVTI